MPRNPRAIKAPSTFLVGAICAVALSVSTAAQEKPSELPTSLAQEYLGLWRISMEFGDLTLEFSSMNGRLAAVLNSDQIPQAQTITDITQSDEGLKLGFDSDYGALLLVLHVEEDELVGTLENAAGDFSVELSGLRDVEEGEETTPRFRRRIRPNATIERGERNIVVGYQDLPVDGPDFANLEHVGVGEIVQFTMSNPIKLRTEENLKFGNTLIKVDNITEGYAGVYSLWLKRTSDGWNLVFNGFPDVWGTQHDPQADVAEFSLAYGTSFTPTEVLVVELAETEDGGFLTIAWGPHRWVTAFDIVTATN